MLWAVESPSRLLQEQTALESLAGEVQWLHSSKWGLSKECLLTINADIIVGAETFQVELVYPNLFPDTPAYVRPRSGTTARWSSHQYGPGGVLCLEWGPDTWRPEVTGADLFRSTYKLLTTERAPGDAPKVVPSRHNLTLGQEVRASVRRLLLNSPVSDFIGSLSDPGYRGLVTRTIYHETNRVFYITTITGTDVAPVKNTELPAGLWESGPLFSWESTGWLFKSSTFTIPASIENSEQLLIAIRAAGFPDFVFPERDATKVISEFLIVVAGPSAKPRAFTAAIHGDGSVKECSIVDTNGSDTQRLPQEHQQLATKRIGIVGLGSVGSKVAVSLARSGAKKFMLVDDDVLLPGNICRNELDWSSVGANKVEAVKESLSLISPDIDVQLRRTRVAGQESAESASTAADALAACDLLIDATANPSVFLLLGAIARRRALPIIWGEVFAGGIGALLARSRPGKDPDAATTRAAFHHHLESLPPAPFVHAPGYDATASTEPLIAYDAEVSHFAAIMTRFVIDTVLNQPSSEFPCSVYLLGFKKAWIFEAPFDTRPLRFDVSLSVEPSLGGADEGAARTAVIAGLAELAKQQSDGNPDNPA